MASTPTRLLTAEEFFWLAKNGRNYELVGGGLHEVSPASPRSGEIGALLVMWLLNFVRPRRLGKVYNAEAGFVLRRNPDVVRAPDAAFVRADRLPPISEQDFYLELAPNLAVEVVSPSVRRADVERKVAEYLAAGVALVWVIDPRTHLAHVYRPDQPVRTFGVADALTGEDVLPDFVLPLRDLFDTH